MFILGDWNMTSLIVCDTKGTSFTFVFLPHPRIVSRADCKARSKIPLLSSCNSSRVTKYSVWPVTANFGQKWHWWLSYKDTKFDFFCIGMQSGDMAADTEVSLVRQHQSEQTVAGLGVGPSGSLPLPHPTDISDNWWVQIMFWAV